MHEFPQVFTNGMMLTVNIGILAYCILSLIKIVAHWKNVRLPVQLAFILISVFLWSAVNVLRFTLDSRPLTYILSLLPLVLLSLTLISVFYFIIRFHNQRAFLRPVIFVYLFVYPAMTIANIIIGRAHLSSPDSSLHLLRQNPVVSTDPLNYVYGDFGLWQYAVSFSSYFLIFALVVVAVVLHLKIPRIYRTPSEKLMTATIVVSSGFASAMLNGLGGREAFPIDFALIGAVFSIRFFYASTLGTQGLVFLSQARNDVIQHLHQSILFLDEENNIIFKNSHASDWLSDIGFEETSFPLLLDCLSGRAVSCERLSDEEGGVDYHYDTGGKKSIFNLRQKPILDKRGRQIGMYAVYSDVTENRELIRRLEVGAGRDVLTGLSNRAMMESLKRELDTIDNLPLSIIIADVNDLKVTNDVHGHQAGDIMLRVCGEALSEKCPPTAQVGRIGGDEFLILLPKTAKLEAEAVMDTIRTHLTMVDDYPYKIVMAMGCAVKSAADQDLVKAMEEADRAMYADKKKIKGGAEIRNMETKLI
ncbi:MAG: diguanylate cyclase [Oscillospiraceae bacterium]|nr:diguanylate cyclase [Oscillospiraceae bacterium]